MLSRTLPIALALALVLASGPAASDASFRSDAPLGDAGPDGVERALQDALERLLVRVSGRRDAIALLDRFPAASSIVRQYRVVEGNRLEAEFDEALVRQVLEDAGVAIWDGERPEVTLWLVVNDGKRWLFEPPKSSEGAILTLDARIVFNGAVSVMLKEASALRGIAIRYAAPPDAAAASQCAEELWTGAFACLPETPGSLLLLGRAGIPSAPEGIEWIVRENGLWGRFWESSAAGAVDAVTDMLAERFMATQGPLRAYQLVVSPVPDIAAYARLKAGLDALTAVRDWRVDAARQDSLALRITSRTDEEPLREALSVLGVAFELSRAGT